MSRTAVLQTTNPATPAPPIDLPLTHQPSYITLTRMLTRLSTSILLKSDSNNTPTPYQETIQRDLSSPLPYHRTKTLYNIEHARTLLLQLEHSARSIKVQRVKRDIVRDLAQKRALVKKLRLRVEEFGREAEARGDVWMQKESDGEMIEQLLGRPPLKDVMKGEEEELQDGRPVSLEQDIINDYTFAEAAQPDFQTAAEDKTSLRRRKGAKTKQDPATSPPESTSTTTSSKLPSSSPSSPAPNPTTEATLFTDSRTHSDLTTSLVSLATQLKQSTRAFHASLESDRGLLDRALEGLDKNVSGLEVASKRMGMLRRMSEGKGWWGRIMLYAWIVGLWVVAVGLVFVGPKFRF